MVTFANREDAGEQLASELQAYNSADAVILGIPRGGVPVAYEVAEKLHAPLSIIGVRKIGSPWNPEFAIGAVSEEDISLLDNDFLEQQHISTSTVRETVREERIELRRRLKLYRQYAPEIDIKGKTVIVVDDGLATGFSAKAAILAVNKKQPKSTLFAAPVCSAEALQDLLSVVNNIVCVATPTDLGSIGEWYGNFKPVSDEEVIRFLQKSQHQTFAKKIQSK